MAITPVTCPGAYDLIIEFQNPTDPNQVWRNTYTFWSPVTVPGPTSSIVTSLIGFAGSTIHPDANLVKASCYAWVRGRQPYPTGSPVFTETFAGAGVAPTYWTALAVPYHPTGGEVVLRMDHEPVTGGKPGRSFFRSLLGTSDISSTSGGKWQLVPSVPALALNLAAILLASGLGAFFGPLGTSGTALCIVRYSPKSTVAPHAVGVTGWSIIGVSTNRQTRKNRR